jgi:poly(3-hydroxybutyrate) depolymerase
MEELVKQWTDAQGADQLPNKQTTVSGHAVKSYDSPTGQEVVRSYLITGMGHGISVDPGTGPQQGGQTTTYSFAMNLWSSFYAAGFFGL